MPGLLVIMGSGETAPTMIKPHRAVFERVGDRPAALVDTPYGFQSNADDISARAVGYFAASVGRSVDVVNWRTAPPPGLRQERALATLRDAGWVFAGPGSPTYALRHWRDTAIESVLPEVLARDGVVTLASAAALTLGSHTVPVYEIYKAGIDPYWEPGLDLVSHLCGLPAVVIPHYDNTEGGHHDTRFCYLGEARLSTMETQLPEESFILGVDEHTAVLLDPDLRTATVVGNGGLTIRRAGRSQVYPAGATVTFDELLALDRRLALDERLGLDQRHALDERHGLDQQIGLDERHGLDPQHGLDEQLGLDQRHGLDQQLGLDERCRAGAAVIPTAGAAPTNLAAIGGGGPASLWATAVQISARFDAALATRDADGCVEAVLALEQAMVDWAADTNVSDEAERTRAQLRTMVVRLGELATIGVRDPRAVVGPFVAGLLEVRVRARAAKDYATSDWVRDCLVAAGVEVRDTPDGPQWSLA